MNSQQVLEAKRIGLDNLKLIVAARIRVHNEINYKESDDNTSKSDLNKARSQKENISNAGTLKSKTIMQSNSLISSQTSITAKTGKTGMSQSRIGSASKQSKKKDDSKVNIFASKMSDKNVLTQIVSLNQVPLSHSLLSKYLKNDTNISTQKQTLLPKSKQFAFDIAFSQESSQEDIYSVLLKMRVKQVLNGFQTSVFVIGSEFSGRKYTIRGDENIMNKNAQNERGLMIRACEDILSLIDISKESIRSRKAIVGGVFYNLGVQIYCVKDDAEVDLLVNAPEQLLNKNETQETEMGCFDITSVSDLLLYYRQAQNRFNMIHDTLKGQDFQRNATIFIRLLILKNKQIYSSVNFAIMFKFDLLNQQRFYPIRDYLREVEKMQKRQLKSYSFNNKILLHINKCFSSGPEYSAVILGSFDSAPPSIENSQYLLQILSQLRQTANTKPQGSVSQQNKKGSQLPANQIDEMANYQEQEQDKEVQAFILNSNRKSQGSNGKSELNETAGFNAITSGQDQLLIDHQSLKSFQGDEVQFTQDQKDELNEVQNAHEQGDPNEETIKQNGNKKFNTFGNDNTYKDRKYGNGEREYENNNENEEYNQQSQETNQEFEESYRVPQDVETAIRDIFSYSDATRGMDESQKLSWVEHQERNLEYFRDSVNFLKPPTKGSTQDQQFRKYMQAKAFLQDLRGELDIKEYVNKNLQDSQNDDNLSSSSSGINTRQYLNNDREQLHNDRLFQRFLFNLQVEGG